MRFQRQWSLLVLLIVSICGEETTTIFPKFNQNVTVDNSSTTINQTNLTTFTVNETLNADFEKNETVIKYKPTLVTPTVTPTELEVVATSNFTEANFTTVNITKPDQRKRDRERIRPDKEEDLDDNNDDDYLDEKSEEIEEEEEENEEKFTSKPSEISLEHIDFVQLRLKHIARSTSNNLTELKLLQEKEFELNEEYKNGWAAGLRLFNESKRWELFEIFKGMKNSSILHVPDEYHIALVTYTLSSPPLYADFNKKTREVCSGKDIEHFHYKSYFKLLLLAIQTLGKETKFKSANRFLYRGVGSIFKLNVGQILAFQHFVSTSTSLKVAENFAGKTLFEMEGPFQGTTMSIRHHSYFDHEEEVIFSPLQVYKVDSKHEGKYYTRYVLVAYEFKLDGDECGFEPIFEKAITNDRTRTQDNNATRGTTTRSNITKNQQSHFVTGNQIDVDRSAGRNLTPCINNWGVIILLRFLLIHNAI